MVLKCVMLLLLMSVLKNSDQLICRSVTNKCGKRKSLHTNLSASVVIDEF